MSAAAAETFKGLSAAIIQMAAPGYSRHSPSRQQVFSRFSSPRRAARFRNLEDKVSSHVDYWKEHLAINVPRS
jgi:hypothetical protein